jgi:MarR family transcriptional regulator, organic hydroperoxide resistance regulator
VEKRRKIYFELTNQNEWHRIWAVTGEKNPVKKLLELYPRIYFACHRRHVRDPRSGGVLSARQGSILDHLDEREAVTVVELARHMGVTASTMSVQVQRLVRTGYVIRERDAEDPRKRNLRLSRSGARIREANSVLDEDRIAEMLERLTPEELEVAMTGLAMLAKAAGEITAKVADREAGEESGEPMEPAPWPQWRGARKEGTESVARDERAGVQAQKPRSDKTETRDRRRPEQPRRQRSPEEEPDVHEVVRELQRMQRELEEMMSGGKKTKSAAGEEESGWEEAEFDDGGGEG